MKPFIYNIINDSSLITEMNLLLDNTDITESPYYYFGSKVPRVTSILKEMIHSDGLMNWANYIGRVKHMDHNKFSENSANIGTRVHDAIEKYVSTGYVETFSDVDNISDKYKMKNAFEAIINNRGKTPKKADTGIPALSAKSVKNNYIDYNACYYISPEEYKRFMVRGKPQKGDILLTTEAPMGMVACLDRDDVAIAQRLLTLRGKENILDNNYLLYYLQSPIGQALLRARETGTTVTGIKQSEFKKIQISIPDIEVQRKIETILRTIDKKIVVNESINRNLGLVA